MSAALLTSEKELAFSFCFQSCDLALSVEVQTMKANGFTIELEAVQEGDKAPDFNVGHISPRKRRKKQWNAFPEEEEEKAMKLCRNQHI